MEGIKYLEKIREIKLNIQNESDLISSYDEKNKVLDKFIKECSNDDHKKYASRELEDNKLYIKYGLIRIQIKRKHLEMIENKELSYE